MPEQAQFRPWTLSEALDIRRGDVVAFVGGGGKTTAMFRLAGELAAEGWRVITTTTTHIGVEQAALAPEHLVWTLDAESPGRLQSALGSHGHVLVTTGLTENGLKWGGVPPEWVAKQKADVILVEADGAKHLPFKAPAAHEPVVPPATTLLVPVVGIDALGRPLEEVAHRPERVSALTGLSAHDPVTEQAIAAVLTHREGSLKGQPAGARVRVLVNKIVSPDDLAAARRLAALLVGSVEAVLLGAVAAEHSILRVERPLAAVVLAAGRSLRMAGPTPKQLLPWGERTVIRQVVKQLASFVLDPILVVTGHRAEEVQEQVKGSGASTVHNANYVAGEMLSSLQVGIRHLPPEAAGCLVVLGDQPWLQAEVVQSVLDAFACGPYGIVAPVFEGRRGHPVLIGRRYWPELMALPADKAPRDVLRRHPADTWLAPVTTESILHDLDTWEDYQRALVTYQVSEAANSA